MRLLGVINQKGGVTKTTTAINASAALAKLGKKVLLIDLDPQANATNTLFSIEEIQKSPTVYHLLMSELKGLDVKFSDVAKTYENGKIKFDVLPAARNLSLVEFELMSESGREFFLRNQIISKLGGYDYAIFDCPPSLGLIVTNIICCSSELELMITVRPDLYSQMGIKDLFEVIGKLKKNLSIQIKDYRVLIAAYDERLNTDKRNGNDIQRNFPEKVFKTMIRKNTTVGGAQDSGMDIFNYNPECTAAIDYLALGKELISME